MKNLVYRTSSKIFITSGLVKKIEHRISLLYPAPRYSVIKRTEQYLIKTYIGGLIITTGLMWFAEVSLYYCCITAIVLYVIMDTHINSALARQELKLLVYFEEFISEVHFSYQFNKMLIEAIENAAYKVPYEMYLHSKLMLSYISDAYEGKGDDYRDIAPNNLFLTFYSLSLTVLLYGDKDRDFSSLYLTNLGYLKEDVNVEILKRRKLESQFIGLSLVTILPMFSIKVIETWAVSNMPELKQNYEGFGGIVSTIILSLITILVYKLLGVLREPYQKREYRSIWQSRLLDISFVNESVLKIIKLTYKSSERLNILLKSIVFPYDIKEFVLRRHTFSAALSLMTYFVFTSIGINQMARILTALGAWFICYGGIYAQVLIKRQIMIMDSEEEIVRFQSVILMLMHMDRISVSEILKEISNFAIIFREEIDGLINKFSYSGMKAFRDAKEIAGFMPFKKLMDGFMAADTLGIEKAFLGIETDRRYYVEKHKQESEEIIAKKSAVGKVAAFIPLCLVIIVKLILPFVLEGMNQLANTGL